MSQSKPRGKRASRSTPIVVLPKPAAGAKPIADMIENGFRDAGAPVTFPWSVGKQLTHLSVDTLRRAFNAGELLAIRVSQNKTLLTRRGLAEWLANKAVRKGDFVKATQERGRRTGSLPKTTKAVAK